MSGSCHRAACAKKQHPACQLRSPHTLDVPFVFRLDETSMNPMPRRETVPSIAASPRAPRRLAARLEPFDSYWQAPKDVEKGYASFAAYYRANYLRHLPQDRNVSILVVSCGPGYLVHTLREHGYLNVIGIDSDAVKVEHARQ